MQIAPAPRTPSPHAKKLLLSFHGVLRLQMAIGGILFGVGLLLSSLCAIVLFDEFSIWHSALSVEAKIISAEREPEMAGELRYQVTYEYQLGGDGSYQGKTSLSVSKDAKVEVGQPLKILASTREPGVSREPGLDTYTGPVLLLLVMGLPFSLMGGNICFRALRDVYRRRRIYRSGEPTPATVISLEDDQLQTFRLTWEFLVDGKPYRGAVNSTKKEDLLALTSGELIALYHPKNPEHNTLYIP